MRWLHDAGHLHETDLPIQRGTSIVVAATPYNSTGKPFAATRNVGPFFINVNLVGEAIVRNSRAIIKAVDLDPADFAVKLN